MNAYWATGFEMGRIRRSIHKWACLAFDLFRHIRNYLEQIGKKYNSISTKIYIYIKYNY